MKRINKISVILLALVFLPVSVVAKENGKDETVRKEREYIRSGNKLYEEKRYADAEVEYKKALSVNPNSNLGNYNLALSLIKQSGGTNPNAEEANNPLKTATELLASVAQNSKDANLRSQAYYNMGNLAFNQQQYDQSIEMYKNALRQNPDDDQARENLRLAQLKKQEQEQNKDKNQDKNKDKDKEKEKEQDQNKDKQDKQDKNEDKQQQQKPQPQQQDLSKENMEQILKTMQNQENATQEKVNAQKPQNIRKTGNQW